MLISYERAKAEALGFDARGGLMERAERLTALGLGVLFETLLVPILWLMLALTAFTAVQRFVVVWRQASDRGARTAAAGAHPAPGPPHAPHIPPRRSGHVAHLQGTVGRGTRAPDRRTAARGAGAGTGALTRR